MPPIVELTPEIIALSDAIIASQTASEVEFPAIGMKVDAMLRTVGNHSPDPAVGPAVELVLQRKRR